MYSDGIGLADIFPVREFHSNYYVPHNLALVVAGKLSSGTSSLLRVVQEQIEPSLISHGHNHGPSPSAWKRPFVETASAIRIPIPATTKHVVEFPEKDECTCFRCLLRFLLRGEIQPWVNYLYVSLDHHQMNTSP